MKRKPKVLPPLPERAAKMLARLKRVRGMSDGEKSVHALGLAATPKNDGNWFKIISACSTVRRAPSGTHKVHAGRHVRREPARRARLDRGRVCVDQSSAAPIWARHQRVPQIESNRSKPKQGVLKRRNARGFYLRRRRPPKF